MYQRFKQTVAYFAALFLMVATFNVDPVFAQSQTKDPSGTCSVNSSQVVINAQTDKFICHATAGASTGIWTALSKLNVRVAYAKYDFSVDGGAISTITPATNTVIPDNAIIFGGILNSTTALTSGGSATVAVGTSAGSSTTALKGATAVGSYTADAILATVPVFTAGSAVKLTAAGSITVTIATATITAGVLEVFLFYVVPGA